MDPSPAHPDPHVVIPGPWGATDSQERVWLHDTVLQTLELLAAGGYRDDPDARWMMGTAARAADQLRAYVEHGTTPPTRGGMGLGAAMRDLVVDEALISSHEVSLDLSDDGSVSGPASADLVAATAELLVNARKHAGARHVHVRCHVARGAARVEVRDDGAGFDAGRTRWRTGLRASVTARIAAHGGRARIRSTPGTGTTVTMTVRAHEAAARQAA